MEALQSLTGDRYRQDVISGHIGNYLIEGNSPAIFAIRLFLTRSSALEYSKASKALGNASDEYPSSQYQRRATPNWDVLCDVFGDLPMVSFRHPDHPQFIQPFAGILCSKRRSQPVQILYHVDSYSPAIFLDITMDIGKCPPKYRVISPTFE